MAIPSGAHRGTGEWWSAARAWAAAGPWRRVRGWWSAPNGRVAVTLALLLGSERNQGWRAVRRGHADDATAWFVSFGRVWRAPTPSVPRPELGLRRSQECANSSSAFYESETGSVRHENVMRVVWWA